MGISRMNGGLGIQDAEKETGSSIGAGHVNDEYNVDAVGEYWDDVVWVCWCL